ncbi:Proteinase inhibitor I13 [Macleaya cordata]|uniref:Proteinase inhibitor I13 n=1 Tax=Macleaya cordata TaxID=56857 RepID=A0A200Q4B9_MACCD|nr:Proteinase inhibitor I13 [Macleaya cordata]
MLHAGKQAWPELVGEKAEIAKEIIERENPSVRVRFIQQGKFRILDFRCNRVWVWTTDEHGSGFVVEVPRVG